MPKTTLSSPVTTLTLLDRKRNADGYLKYRTEKGEVLRWSGQHVVPRIGAKVHVWLNHFGDGKVLGYFACGSNLGLRVGANNHEVEVFGSELGRREEE